MPTELDFTIITPSYNYGRFIRDCLESVKNQDGVTFEHLIFDACSTDDTHEILKDYPHATVVIEKDKGMSDAINKGFRAAKGKWVMWLNTDDYFLPGTLKAVKEIAEKHPEADIINGGWNFIDAQGHITRTMRALPLDINMLIYYGSYMPSTAFFVKRSTTIDQGILLNENFRYNMDGEWAVRLAVAGKKFIPFNRPLANFRWHDDNLSNIRAGKHAIEDDLVRERQEAERQAIRKFYGKNWIKNLFLYNIFAPYVYQYYRLKKAYYTFTSTPE